jgi:hypothetical protein
MLDTERIKQVIGAYGVFPAVVGYGGPLAQDIDFP